MGLKKIRVLPDQYIVREGEKGETAFLVISGGLVAEIEGKKIGKIETGEIFGDLSLILNENRTASINAIVPSDIVEINLKNSNGGNYRYIELKNIVNNFMIAYVGQDKVIPKMKICH